MSDDDQRQRLARLEARIAAARKAAEPPPRREDHHAQAHLAWRMVIELVAGLGIGFGMGYGLDRLFGTIPVFLVLFTLLGLAAGIRTMLRSAREIQGERMAGPAGQEDERG
ncbi:MAG: AtpZ/AtpI family protein [Rhodobacteraceae bacterium]|nr:AtpZ/AtpI family protein [Paracoccaceae bacterium]